MTKNEAIELDKDDLTIPSYCIHCWVLCTFSLVDGRWKCDECGTPLKKAGEK